MQLPNKLKRNHDLTETEPIEPIFDYTAVVETDDKEVNGVKVSIRKVTRKGVCNKTETKTKPIVTRKRAADSTQEPIKRRKVTVKNEPQNEIPKQKTEKNPKELTEKKKPAPAKRKLNIAPRRTLRGKGKVDDVCTENSVPKETVESVEETIPIPGRIDSRKTSENSASEFSWTKDISSSSTTTCVTVSTNEFVRIDNKIPILQLVNVDSVIKKYEMCESDDSSSKSESSSSDSSSDIDIDVQSACLNLSTSSPSIVKCHQMETPKSDSIKGDVTKALVKLTSMLKNFDMEIMNWIGYGENVDDNTKKCNDNILKVLKEESQVIEHCRRLKNILSDKTDDDKDVQLNTVLANELNVSFDDDNPITNHNVLLTDNVDYPQSPKSPSIAYDSDYALDNFNYMSFERNNDDDDALSLFAESITGIEPSRSINSSESPNLAEDEYIPQPVNKDSSCSSEKYQYSPTEINKLEGPAAVRKNVCEKQTADSTSIYKEVEDNICQDTEGTSGPAVAFDDNQEDGEIVDTEDLPNQIGPPPVTSIFQKLPRRSTTMFKGICFYNLINACKKSRCTYPHLVPSSTYIKTCFMRLSDSAIIAEYIFLSSWPILRRKFGLYFVEECHRRGLPRVLVEIAIDFSLKFKPKTKDDSDFHLSVLEAVLLSLNDVGLVVCEDLLDWKLGGDIRLCDVLMRVIAMSQNFSRFKDVFLNLTNVMIRHKRTFNSDVTTLILERVCILPTDERLLRAVLDIIKNTDSSILNNSMISQFGARLKTVNSVLYEEFVEFKTKNVDSQSVDSLVMSLFPNKSSPVKLKDLEQLHRNCINNVVKERYTSPDTTKADTLQTNPIPAPTIKRTVNFTRTCYSTPKKNVEHWLNKCNSWQGSPIRAPVPLMSMSLVRPVMPQNGRLVSNYRTPTTVCN